ncbi:MAG: DUF4070 domain-containing protein [Acidobacteria bacterium]|jgi:radical SAM superfamily enzyme YgiQ (UPF0313 family)|nr:DUF4070 domain-containing protein [Acidobacteriota bacterium]
MKVLLVNPRFPTTYWGYQYSLQVIGKKASLPPLGLITVAACLPPTWELRLVDLNLRPLADADLIWADAVLIGGMLLQLGSMRQVMARARECGRRVVVGGPAPSESPELFEGADVVFRGEVEGRVGELVRAISAGGDGPLVLTPPAKTFPAMNGVPAARFDLLDLDGYASMSVQYSRGCPYDCEFCDIVQLFGRVPRVKHPPQVLAELDRLYELGWRGSLFFVDDNFIGNRREVRRLLPTVAHWQEARGHPFDLYTEASLDLARDPSLVREMVRAGFSAVFVGIETPSEEALRSCGKLQNLKVETTQAVDLLTGAGLEVMGGFIVGFDTDGPDIFAAHRELLYSAPIPLAMIGLLSAVPGTALWRRLELEGRLRGNPSGDQFDRPNFEPVMDEETLLRGYAELLAELYCPREYYRRCATFLGRVGRTPPVRGRGLSDLAAFFNGVLHVGILGRRRRHFWALLWHTLTRAPKAFRRAVTCAIKGEHMIRYTEEHVLPRIAKAAAEARAENDRSRVFEEARWLEPVVDEQTSAAAG